MKNDHNETNPMMVALIGGAVGAAAALFFSDERRRTALKNMFADLNARSAEIPGKVQQLTSDLTKKAQDLTDSVVKDDVPSKVEKAVNKRTDSK